MQTLLEPLFWVFFIALVAAICILKKIASRQAYIQGASDGFALGIDQTVELLVQRLDFQKMIAEQGSTPLSKSQLVEILAPIAIANLVDKLDNRRQK